MTQEQLAKFRKARRHYLRDLSKLRSKYFKIFMDILKSEE